MPKRIYFDHNATTPLHPEVKKTIIEVMENFGNPSSFHQYGREARKLVEEGRERVAAFIGAHPDEIVFVASGSEANNAVFSNLTCGSDFCSFKTRYEKKVITTKIEHPCILESAKCVNERGIDIEYLDVDEFGKIYLDQLDDLLKGNVGMVSVMMANNEIGTIQDIKHIAEICHSRGVLVHTDAAQAVGKVPVNVNELGVDLLTISAHKIYGPKGVGVLYIRKNTPFCPFIRGGHQERGRRAGTENTIGIAALGKAVEMRAREMVEEEKRLLHFKEVLKKGITERIPDIKYNGHPVDCLPGTLNVSFDGAEGEAILLYLDLEGIAVSTGSACASGSLDPSHVLIATGLPVERAHGSIRIGLGRENTLEEVEYFLDVMENVIKKIRSMSTVYAGRK